MYVLAVAGFALFAPAQACYARSSVNIPASSRLYDDFERLEIKGLLHSNMYATRPFDRLEGARLVAEGAELAPRAGGAAISALPVLKRLEREFAAELASFDGEFARLKPVESIYMETLWSEKTSYFADVNNNGDEFTDGLNNRAGLVLTGSLFGAASFYLNPEFRMGGGGSMGRVVSGYVKLDLLGMSLTAGRDSLWWGPGYHGNLLVTDNARPLDQIMLTSQSPFTLPWVFRRIGLIKPSIFVARLEQDRFYRGLTFWA